VTSKATKDVEQDHLWLDDDERSLWLSLTCVLMKLPAALDAQLQKSVELTFFEYLLLAMLCEQPTRTLKMSELASITNASLSRLSHVARRLESRGLLSRSEDESDRRCTNATVTKSGVALVEVAAPDHVMTVRQLVIDAVGTSAMESFAHGCHAIAQAVDPGGKRSVNPDCTS
jgi:DNA-binding MarR family transcriptional regulator